MSLIKLTCFVDVTAGGFVAGLLSREPVQLRNIGQQDAISWNIQFLELLPDQGYSAPYSVVPVTGSALRVGVGFLGDTPLAEQDTWTYDATFNAVRGVLALDTEAMRAEFGTGIDYITPYLEFQFTDADGVITPIHQEITVFRELILAGSPEPAPPGLTYYSQTEALALFVQRIGAPGAGRYITSPDGTMTVFEYLGNDGSMHYDPVSPPVS